MQKVIIAGFAGNDPDFKYIGNSDDSYGVANFSVAVNERVKDNGEWKDHVEWFRCVAYGKTAEYVAEKVEKGTFVVIDGKRRTREYIDKNGQKRMVEETVIKDITAK